MERSSRLELLAPAKNLECGLAAIHHGADAVYIGAPRFGAREAAGNSIEEIGRLAAEARIFGVKTYVALNTILYDGELEEAREIIRQVYEEGADALIIQDFGILEMDLPPIPLHASTQANNFTPAKVKFLSGIGFKRAVLARELSLAQIREIADQSSIELEAFVHGSLCVCLSGQCYMSQVAGGRSANRGACAQPCRKTYTLKDAAGQVILRDKHLLSLRDLDRSGSLRELAEAGVRSFKIEGRLKDAAYVKNITAWYRKELDRILEQEPAYAPASCGRTTFFFEPDPARTFHRDSTEYFLNGRKETVASIHSPKSTGEKLGEASLVTGEYFRLNSAATVSNNDGLTFLNRQGVSCGLKVNRVENGNIWPDRMNGLFKGAVVYRNLDHAFQITLAGKSSERKIGISLSLQETSDGFSLKSSSGHQAELLIPKTAARDTGSSRLNIVRQLSKSGETPFLVESVDTGGNEQNFFTMQQLNDLRRSLLDKIVTERSARPARQESPGDTVPGKNNPETLTSALPPGLPDEAWNFELNISNRLARRFYQRFGLSNPPVAFEKRKHAGRLQVMITRHCIQHELGFCSRYGGTFPAGYSLPFQLQDGTETYELEFDCRNCMMRVLTTTGNPV